MTCQESDVVLKFWFSSCTAGDQLAMARQLEWWFRGGADNDIRDRFAELSERAASGVLQSWSDDPRSRLALIVVLDQFSRTIYRGTARAFAQDAKARALTLEGIDVGHYARLEAPWEKTFFFLPLSHSEDMEHQELAVELAEEVAEHAPLEQRALLHFSAAQARGHRDVIARFGRHPHRNAILGRQSTPEELRYLATGQLVHTRAISPTSS